MTVRHTVFVWVAIILSASGCQEENRHAPRLNVIDEEQFAAFTKGVEVARTLPDGHHDFATIPRGFPLSIQSLEVERGRAYVFRFPSLPIETNPIYVFVEPDVNDPEGWVRDFIRGRGWRYGRKLDNPGWHYVHGN